MGVCLKLGEQNWRACIRIFGKVRRTGQNLNMFCSARHEKVTSIARNSRLEEPDLWDSSEGAAQLATATSTSAPQGLTKWHCTALAVDSGAFLNPPFLRSSPGDLFLHPQLLHGMQAPLLKALSARWGNPKP